MEKETGCNAADSFDILLENKEGNYGIVHYSDSALTVSATTAGPKGVADGLYHHVAIVRQSDTVSIYIDGSFINSQSAGSPADISNAAPLVAGISLSDCAPNFTGDLDELDLWNRALSSAEIFAIFNAGSLGKYNTTSLYPNFQVVFEGISTNTIIVTNFSATNWQAYTNSFIATNNQTTIELTGNTLGVLLDDISLVQLRLHQF